MNRDPRRLATVEQRRDLYVQAKGRCQKCGQPLGDDWQAAHLVAWSNSGPTTMENLEAWCKPCNLKQGAENATLPPELVLRPWQEEALPKVLDAIWLDGVATAAAAAGAGKTILAGTTFKHLQAAGFVERLVVVVPNSNLRRQWTDSLSNDLLINLDWEPRDGWMERRDTLGCVVTYHSLPNTARNHLFELQQRSTMFVFDEVHHVGDQKAWGQAVLRMIGDVSVGPPHCAAVLNMTGTLFRSSDKLRISTVKYTQVIDVDPSQVEAKADYTVFTRDLIPHTLRSPYVYDYDKEVRLLDMDSSEIIEGDYADLDQKQRSAALRDSFKRESYIEEFVAESLRMLSLQQKAIGPQPALKILCVCATIEQARLYANVYNRLMSRHFARLVTSETPQANAILRRAAREDRSLAIVSVQMVTEGFDCPAVSTIAYASNVMTDLKIAQTMARAMRLTQAERQTGQVLPAQFLIPADPKLKKAFREALGRRMHVLNAEDPKRPDDATGGVGGGERSERYQVLDLTDPVLRGADVPAVEEGQTTAEELEIARPILNKVGIPETYLPGFTVARRLMQEEAPFPDIYKPPDRRAAPTSRPADPRTVNKAHREALKKPRGWMVNHISHDKRYLNMGTFVNLSMEEVGIPPGGLDQASPEQLMASRAWMIDRIREHCRTNDEPIPIWARGSDGDS